MKMQGILGEGRKKGRQ